ncbi:FAD/FMN-containing dehydrogenase [Blastomonas natatoria]|uniref:FAD/FMN-containing dehydrogenase n=1 Tax=Blastomonas natatoria TaxID=34015 RepID=A0A2V3UP48_9SPHN|nr:FAD-binding oxidoreductase [Blastomonas natatoria]PXW68162.1 FAD/FMN-containing dehydrogenase [Blastomonas natatoria]
MTDSLTRNDLTERLSQILGPRGLTTDGADLAPWLTDWRGRFHGQALAMVAPADTMETAAIVRLASETGTPIVPQGGNSGMVGGATPDAEGRSLLLSTRRMNAIRSIDTAARTVVAEAGVVLQTLHEAVSAHGLRFPLTLGGKGSATVGGLVSTNAGGTQVLRHGTMRALVEGVEAVLPDGSIYDGLATLKKDNRGYDIRHLLVGAEGTLGIVTAATLKLVPALIDRAVVWAGVASPLVARELLLMLEARAGREMEGFEIVPQRCLANVLKHIPGTRSPLEGAHPWHVLVEFGRDDAAATAPQILAEALMAEAFERGLVQDAAISVSESQAEAFWKLRDSISEAERTEGPAMQHDISVPVADMPRFILEAGATVEQRFAGTEVAAFGHMGDGNVHFHVAAPPGADRATWPDHPGKEISAFVHDLVVAAGGSISAEHGIGQMKRDELGRLSDPARLMALRAIKHAFDPKGIMNPGKLVPL